MWAIGGHELGTLSIRVHNSLTVHYNLWALKFDNFSEFQNVKRPPHPPPIPSVIMTLCVRKSICDSPLICMNNYYSYSINTIKFTTVPIVSYLILFEHMCITRNLQKNLNIIWQPPFLDTAAHFVLAPFFFLAKTYSPQKSAENLTVIAEFTSQSYLRNKFIVFWCFQEE